jgi:hypothetical protein
LTRPAAEHEAEQQDNQAGWFEHAPPDASCELCFLTLAQIFRREHPGECASPMHMAPQAGADCFRSLRAAADDGMPLQRTAKGEGNPVDAG